VGIICPLGWDRINWSAIIWGGFGSHSPLDSNSHGVLVGDLLRTWNLIYSFILCPARRFIILWWLEMQFVTVFNFSEKKWWTLTLIEVMEDFWVLRHIRFLRLRFRCLFWCKRVIQIGLWVIFSLAWVFFCFRWIFVLCWGPGLRFWVLRHIRFLRLRFRCLFWCKRVINIGL